MNTSSGDVLIHDWNIGKLIASDAKLSNLCREEVYGILTCEPPMATSEYPGTRQSESGSFRQFQPSWVQQFPWLHYSKFEDGALLGMCNFCSQFNQGTGSQAICYTTFQDVDKGFGEN